MSIFVSDHLLVFTGWCCARRLGELQFLANCGPQSPVFEAGKEPRVNVRLFWSLFPISGSRFLLAKLPKLSREQRHWLFAKTRQGHAAHGPDANLSGHLYAQR